MVVEEPDELQGMMQYLWKPALGRPPCASGHGAAASGNLATVTTEGSRSYKANEIRGQLRDTR